MVSILQALRRIKDAPLDVLTRSSIEAACRRHGHRWRDGVLDPVRTVELFIRQVANGNVSCTEVRRLAGAGFTPAAYCQARQRLPLAVLAELAGQVSDAALAFTGKTEAFSYKGHRTRLIDGSSLSMPDTPQLQEQFGQHGAQAPGCGFPTAHLMALFDHRSGLLLGAELSPLRTHDMARASDTHELMGQGDLLLGDGAFGTYAHFALLLGKKMHGLFPAHHKRIVNFRPGRPCARPGQKSPLRGLPRSAWVKSLGVADQLVEWFKPVERPDWMSRQEYDALPDSIIVRELRRTVRRPGFRPITLTVVTTLLDPVRYPAEELMQLRFGRWEVETNLRHLKTTMGMEVLHCKSAEGVRKEVCVFALVYNLVRLVMLRAGRRQRVAVERVSFADALRWLRHARAGEDLPDLIINPYRPGRVEPRCKKRRPKSHPLMTVPREKLRNALKNSGKVA
jgi:hypothetical protein